MSQIFNPEFLPNMVVLWFGVAANVPAGWAICDGTNGTPDMRGRVPVGVDTGQTEFDVLGEAGGAKTHALSTAEMPAHAHESGPSSVSIYRVVGGAFQLTHTGPNAAGTQAMNTLNTSSIGSGTAHNNLQPYRALHFIMKL